jgi:hypothetical protein
MIDAIQQVQLAMPPGLETEAEAFYAGVLGILAPSAITMESATRESQ